MTQEQLVSGVRTLALVLHVGVEVVVKRLCWLVGQVVDFVRDLGLAAGSLLVQLWGGLTRITPVTWTALLTENTSPIPRATVLNNNLLSTGVGRVGEVDIPLHIWEETIPEDFLRQSKVSIEGVGEVGDKAAIVLKAMIGSGQNMFANITQGEGDQMGGPLSFLRAPRRRLSSFTWCHPMPWRGEIQDISLCPPWRSSQFSSNKRWATSWEA